MATPSDTEPFDSGTLDVGDGHRLHWEVCGNPDGKVAVVLHGGPGSGCTPWYRQWFDPAVYRIVLFDQRNCGRSTPHAASPSSTCPPTPRRTWSATSSGCEHLGVDRWLVAGVSWGTTLGLAYGQAHPDRITEMVLNSVVTTTRAEVEWLTRAMGRVFPQQWQRFRDGVPERDRDGDLAEAYSRLLHEPDPGVRDRAAAAWCA